MMRTTEKDKKKCSHGRDKFWCCECRYGKCQEMEHPNKDMVTDVKRMNMNYSRKDNDAND